MVIQGLPVLTYTHLLSVSYLFIQYYTIHYLLWHYLLHISATFCIRIYIPALTAIPILSSSDPC